jgi:hypothetical protein
LFSFYGQNSLQHESNVETSKNKLFYIYKIAVEETHCMMKPLPLPYSTLIYVALCIIQNGIVNNSFRQNSTTQREEQTGYAIYST